MNQIVLKGCELESLGGKARLTARVSGAESLWFEVEACYQDMLDTSSVDAFFILYLWLAMENGVDLCVEAPVSQKLSNAVTKDIQSMFLILCSRLHDIDVRVLAPQAIWPKADHYESGTGFSAGVDSWYTALKAEEKGQPYTCYVFANTGQHGLHSIDEVVSQRAGVAERSLKTMERPLIVVNTNIDQVFRERFQQRDVIGNISCVLALQNGISRYAYSASYSDQESGIVTHYDMAIMDPYLLPLLSTERAEFVSIGVGTTRIDKLRFIAEQKRFSKKLYVCIEKDLPIRNCGLCFKCRRTQLALESIHLQALIPESFDYEIYQKKRTGLLVGLYASAKKDSLDLEIVDELNKRYGIKLLPHRLAASIWSAVRKYLPAGVKWRIEARVPYLF